MSGGKFHVNMGLASGSTEEDIPEARAVAVPEKVRIKGITKDNSVLPAWFYEDDPKAAELRVRKDALRTMLVVIWNECQETRNMGVALGAVKELMRLEGYGTAAAGKESGNVKINATFGVPPIPE